jgi:hypothetical protein
MSTMTNMNSPSAKCSPKNSKWGRPGTANHAFRLVLVTAFGMAAMGSAITAASTPAGADTTLGGFTVAAVASGITASYEQPNFPVPATPTVELNVGYSNTTDNFGPTGSTLASSLYPGQVIANSGPELGLLFPGVPLPPAPIWPIEATTACPKGPNATNNSTPGATMEADCKTDSNTAITSFGSPGSNATGPPAAAPSSGSGAPGLGPVLGIGSVLSSGSPTPSAPVGNDLLTMQGLSSTSTSGATGPKATATATADASGISILGGLITIGSVTTTATAISDGTTGTLSGASTAQHVVVAGQPVTIDSSGIHAAGNPGPGNPVLPVVQQVLSAAGITMTMTNPTDINQGPQVSRQWDGFRIQIDLTTLDGAAGTLSKLVPASVLANLPLPVPDKQILVLDIGWVSVQSAASPAYVFNPLASSSSSPSDSGALGGSSGTSGTTGTDGSQVGDSSLGTPGTPSTSGTPGTNTLGGTSAVAASPLFKGISGGLLALALLAAVALGLAYLRTQSFIEAAGAGAACPIGETGGGSGGFGGGPDPADDDIFGGDPLYSGIDTSLTGA